MNSRCLAICVGFAILRSEEEPTAASIVDIKLGNAVVEILIDNYFQVCSP